MKRYAVIVAGGRGVRMGGDVPKQFLPLLGEPVLMHTLRRFHEAAVDLIVVVLPQAQHEYWQQLCRQHDFRLPHRVAAGGSERFHSVQNGLSLLPDDEEALVAVHDGVRPLVAPDTIRRCYEEAERSGAAIPTTPVVETLRSLQPDGSSCTVPRDRFRLVQTPQVFRLGLLRQAYLQPFQPAFTDDASVVEAMGHPVALVEGNRENLKLTTPADLLMAESLMERLKG